ncbi:MAG: 5-methyltetrahydropteroyltriglutamate--homocysteine methyltransferase [Gaiellales bacterium]|nr:5-methyltetrahydropteroyltriglutamate--homocysteine methyltransferase [Gaiellales bacterium]
MGRIRTTHVGSLIRPPAMLPFLRAIENGEPYDQAAYEECLRSAVEEVVRQQVATGIDIVSDGEFGKSWTWAWYCRDRLGGFEERPWGPEGPQEPARVTNDRREFAEFYAEYLRVHQTTEGIRVRGQSVCVAPITYEGRAAIERDASTLKLAAQAAGAEDAFLPVVAPSSAMPVRADEYYGDDAEFIFALADALNVEYRAVIDAGLSVQLDDAFLATMFDTMVPPATLADYRDWAELRIEATNRALAGIPEARSRYHVCWGSWNGPHTNDVPLRDIIDLVLRVRVGAYALEQANPRHEHEWRVWEDVALPEGKTLIPGVISHSTNVVEHPELVAERIVRLAQLVGRERVIAGTDCGFAQDPFIQRVHPSIMWAKLGALAEGARIASGRLWP